MKAPVIVSLGGSIIVPDQIDTDYLKQFKELILDLSKENEFIIVTGGGKTCRRYVAAASEVTDLETVDKDWLGIQVTILNANLMKHIFKGYCHPNIIGNPTEKQDIKHKLAFGAGYEPGASSDIDAVLLAKTYGSKVVINLSNIDYIYDKDPKEEGAKHFEEMTWSQLQDIVGTKWEASGNYPFDPEATKLAKELDLTLYCLNGRKLEEVRNALQHKPFKGTMVKGQ